QGRQTFNLAVCVGIGAGSTSREDKLSTLMCVGIGAGTISKAEQTSAWLIVKGLEFVRQEIETRKAGLRVKVLELFRQCKGDKSSSLMTVKFFSLFDKASNPSGQ
ncbi:hypothetical protein CHS0354_028926, partial [Potamilus streckersoni]